MNRAFILLFVLIVPFVRETMAQGPPDGLRVDIAASEGTLGEVAGVVRRATGANIVFLGSDSDLSTLPVELELTNVRWRTALELAVKQVGCVLDEDRDGILLVSSPPRVTFQFPNADLS